MYIWFVLRAAVALPYDKMTPDTSLTALTIMSTPVITTGGFLT
jgi:hypothetical protein